MLRLLAKLDDIQSWWSAPDRVFGRIGKFTLLGDVEGDKVSLSEPLENSIRHQPLIASFATSIPSLHQSENLS